MIAKIIGVYKFEGFETGPISLIVMKNVTKCPKIGINRIFDIKGSSHDREVMIMKKYKTEIGSSAGSSSSGSQKSKKKNSARKISNNFQVLKDKDFISLETQLNIN